VIPRRGGGSPRTLVAAFGVVLVSMGCGSPTTVATPAVVVVVASGDGQYGTVGAVLTQPLRVLVQSITGQLPQEGTSVTWRVTSGDASIEGPITTATDSTGSAEVRLRLGSSTGVVTVEATAMARNTASASFQAFTVAQPQLQAISPTTVAPGGTVTLTGSNFSPDATQNVVLFQGVRGRVVVAGPNELTVEVPPCLPARTTEVRVQLGVVSSGPAALEVTAGGSLVTLPVGGVIDIWDEEAYACHGLPGGASYLALVYSAGTVGAAKHPYQLDLVGSAASAGPLVAGHVARATTSPAAEALAGVPDGVHATWEWMLREAEAELVRSARRAPEGVGGGSGALRAPLAAPPAVGSTRSFDVYQSAGSFTRVTAVARHVSDRAALFVDQQAPAGGFTDDDLRALADRFDDAIYPEVTEAFGTESDLDENERVVILFTPAVNALTPRGAGGFVAGFFYGIDLLPDREGSNRGEVFYSLVPDPSGVFSDPRSRDAVNAVTPAVLAHEFQHMVHFNQRVLVRGADTPEALWLGEAMAQYAEEAVARHYEEAGDDVSVELFREGTRVRARRYLSRPDTVSLIISTGKGSLPERGAGFLELLYLHDQHGDDLLRRLAQTTRIGVGNVEAETGRNWASLLADWWSAVYLDDGGPGSGALAYPTVDLRAFLGNPFPLEPVELGGGDLTRSDSLWSSSAAYYIVTPATGGSTTVRLGGENGAPSTPQAGLRMRIIRIS
jgi:hypothetical protein